MQKHLLALLLALPCLGQAQTPFAYTVKGKLDHLAWTQVADLKGLQNAAAQRYAVQAIPQNFLVGPDGKIVAVNLHGVELGATLAKLIK
ncbi:peroxiredoxin family protein [Hymenobacter artigasi]|uniref:Thioredoxin-like fold domain-containing protein n=1 Tax=Hymenobacter artigasi TaxID=2719616 RepID=A0ABX1HIT4_9BACT|nr:hypothetical protein [Hymenobacter artigasi]NKI90110.1 hypothetical protein [Hymenobacter artigasi]